MKRSKIITLHILISLVLLVASSANSRHREGNEASTDVTMTTPLEKNAGVSASFVEQNRSRAGGNQSKNSRETKVESLDVFESINLESDESLHSTAINPFPRTSFQLSLDRLRRSRKTTHSQAGPNSFGHVLLRNYSFHHRNYSQHLPEGSFGSPLKSTKNIQIAKHRIHRSSFGQNLGGKIHKRNLRNDFSRFNDPHTPKTDPGTITKQRKRVKSRVKIQDNMSSARFSTSVKANPTATISQKRLLINSRPAQLSTASPSPASVRIRKGRHIPSSPKSEEERSDCWKTLEKEIICCTTEFVQLLGNFMMPREIFASENHLKPICR